MEPCQNTGRRRVRIEALLLGLDIAASFMVIQAALWLRFAGEIPPEHQIPYLTYWPLLAGWRIFVALCAGLYDFRHRLSKTDHAFAAFWAGMGGVLPGYVFLAMAQLYNDPLMQLSRVAGLCDLLLMIGWFAASRAVVLAGLRAAGRRIRIVIAGPEAECERLAREIRAYAPRDVVVEAVTGGDINEGMDPLAGRSVDWVILSTDMPRQETLRAWLGCCGRAHADLFLHPGINLAVLANAPVFSLAGIPLIAVAAAVQLAPYRVGKRLMDVAVSLAVLIVGAPVWLCLAALVRLTSPGPVFFTQERVGWCGKPFRVIKFRTMRPEAESETGPVLSRAHDPRVTPLGRLLRRTRLDEIPQFWNVLIGQMSLVGPRPERAAFIERFLVETPLYERRLLVKPGLTGLAQIHGRYDTDYVEKLRYDLMYINGVSLGLDLRILLATLRTVLTGRGAR